MKISCVRIGEACSLLLAQTLIEYWPGTAIVTSKKAPLLGDIPGE